jgi:hypothetical protein
MELGKAKYGSGKNTFKIKDGDNVYRILPPMGKLAKKGFWNQYYRVEWGFKNSAGKNRPFQDVRVVNFQTKMVEVESAAHLQREGLKAQKTALVAELRKDPTNAALKQQVAEVTEAIKRYNLDAKYYLNAIDLEGKIGLLKIGSRAFKALKVEIDKLRKQGIDPLSVENGRFFNFNRSNATGNFQDTAYQVTPYKENVVVNGETYQKDKVHVLDQSIIDRLSDEAFELSGMYPEVTPAQVERMVREGATAVDEILGAGNESAASDDGGEEGEETSSTTTAAATQTTTTAPKQAAPAAAAPTTATTLPPTQPITASEVKAATPAASTTTPAAPAAKGDLSEDDFLRSIGALK